MFTEINTTNIFDIVGSTTLKESKSYLGQHSLFTRSHISSQPAVVSKLKVAFATIRTYVSQRDTPVLIRRSAYNSYPNLFGAGDSEL